MDERDLPKSREGVLDGVRIGDTEGGRLFVTGKLWPETMRDSDCPKLRRGNIPIGEPLLKRGFRGSCPVIGIICGSSHNDRQLYGEQIRSSLTLPRSGVLRWRGFSPLIRNSLLIEPFHPLGYEGKFIG